MLFPESEVDRVDQKFNSATSVKWYSITEKDLITFTRTYQLKQ